MRHAVSHSAAHGGNHLTEQQQNNLLEAMTCVSAASVLSTAGTSNSKITDGTGHITTTAADRLHA